MARAGRRRGFLSSAKHRGSKACSTPSSATPGIAGRDRPVDIGIAAGRITAIEAALPEGPPSRSAEGRLVCGGFTDAHIHLDKACILDRCPICEGTLAEAVALTPAAKAAFTAEDVYARGLAGRGEGDRSRHDCACAASSRPTRAPGCARSRPSCGSGGTIAFALDLDLCAFAQEGLTQEMETYGLLEAA